MPRQLERQGLAFGDREVAHRAQILAADVDRRAEAPRIGARGGQKPVVGAADPRNPGPVGRPEHEIHAHRHASASPLDHADEIRHPRARRHAVHDGDDAGLGLELRLEDERVGTIAPPAAPAQIGRRRQEPAAVVGRPQQRGEARRRVEPRNTEPVDGAVAADERGGLAIADQGVILDP
jgi:hypothetical protein